MAKTETNPKVEGYLKRAERWGEEMRVLREIVLPMGMVEDLKWGKPCYTVEGRNVVLIIGFKEYCAYLFTKGALMKDPEKILVRPGENTQSSRQARFTSMKQIQGLKKALKGYVAEAAELERAGVEYEYKKPVEQPVPEELQRVFDKNAKFEKAFKALTPGRQRAYKIYFAAAKQVKTREARIEKCMPQIFEGIGWNEEYRRK